MHRISREAERRLKCTRETVEETGFPDASLKSSLLVLSVVLRSKNTLQVVAIFERIHRREVRDVNIRMAAGWVVFSVRSKQRRIIVRPIRFVSSDELAEQPAASPTVMADRTTEFCHPNGISEGENKKQHRDKDSASIGIVDAKSFFL